ncbi:hypothetical protein SAMN05892883_1885 [Jatrophihabitans sp. GAS493]|uniref:hypothetical protein n=1 Tax=Jatrophihabitans sp. GAS493 TaxID=1907575 RepID=UPI000BBF87C5|nr:hypothetical protein [Jatrophihabitans sp. GAS493]SOD72494.1 hypothetical protein SAMN05892883_1885 [Jatrophihabitans sp. GAS493]
MPSSRHATRSGPLTTSVALLVALMITLTGCSSKGTATAVATTSNPGLAATPTASTAATSPANSATTSAATTSAASGSAATSSPASTHPVKAVRTLTVAGASGRKYPITIWGEDKISTCHDHAYGAPMIAFLISHPCGGANRLLFTTKVNGAGRTIAVSLIETSFAGSSPDKPYDNANAFQTLVSKDGTGNINDLLREGYRLPDGTSRIPTPDAFTALGQDAGVWVYDLWYTTGRTPNNAPELILLAQDLFLQPISTG